MPFLTRATWIESDRPLFDAAERLVRPFPVVYERAILELIRDQKNSLSNLLNCLIGVLSSNFADINTGDLLINFGFELDLR